MRKQALVELLVLLAEPLVLLVRLLQGKRAVVEMPGKLVPGVEGVAACQAACRDQVAPLASQVAPLPVKTGLVKAVHPVFRVRVHPGDPQGWGKIHHRYQVLSNVRLPRMEHAMNYRLWYWGAYLLIISATLGVMSVSWSS
ncbi:MAG: hypothetical protein ABI270_09755 [Nitrosospira sp.]